MAYGILKLINMVLTRLGFGQKLCLVWTCKCISGVLTTFGTVHVQWKRLDNESNRREKANLLSCHMYKHFKNALLTVHASSMTDKQFSCVHVKSTTIMKIK